MSLRRHVRQNSSSSSSDFTPAPGFFPGVYDQGDKSSTGSIHINISHEYKPKLIGILPCKFKHSESSSAWNVSNLRQVKKPSDYSSDGGSQLETFGHAALIGSAIVERRFGMCGFMSLVTDTSSSDEISADDKKNSDENNIKNNDDNTAEPEVPSPTSSNDSLTAKIEILTSEKQEKDTQNEESTIPIQGQEHSQRELDPEKAENENPGFPVTNLYKNCFESGKGQWDKIPDFMCERLVLIFLSSETDAFALQARKVKFRPRKSTNPEEEFETIEITFPADSMKPLIDVKARTGPSFVKWATDPTSTDSSQSQSQNQKEGNNQNSKDHEDENNNDNNVIYNHGFVEGSLTRHFQTNSASATSTHSRTFTMGMMAAVAGVWKIEENPENYTCSHLAEMRTAQETTVAPIAPWGERNSFYKQVRMKRNWIQATLAGEKKYLVGINGILSEKPLARVIKELWLMDVDRIPRAIQISAADENFVPWTPEDLFEKLFDALELIHKTVHSKKGTPEEYNSFTFLKYPKDSDVLIHDVDGKLFEEFSIAKRSVILRGLPISLPNEILQKSSPQYEENPNSNLPPLVPGTEEYFKKLEKYTLSKIFRYIQWPPCLPLPFSIKRNMISASWHYSESSQYHHNEGKFGGWELQLNFEDAELASIFIEVVRGYWGKYTTLLKNVAVDIPPGFERMKADQPQIRLPRDHPLARSSNIGMGLGMGLGMKGRPNRGAGNGGGHFRSNSDPFTYKPPFFRPRHRRESSLTIEINDNWRK